MPERRAIYLGVVGMMSSGGLITVWLVRPKNAAADLASGIITGVLAAVLCYTLSWGWVAVKIAGVPYGIWLGMAAALVSMTSLTISHTMTAGMLIRRHGRVRAAIIPYIEVIIPIMLAMICATSVLFRVATSGLSTYAWRLLLLPLPLMAILGVLKAWPWPIRLLLHAGWMTSVYVFGLR